jgi:hypothetical protein
MGQMGQMGAMGGMGGGMGQMGMGGGMDDAEAVVFQVAYGKPGPLGIDLCPHVVMYMLNGAFQAAHVAVVKGCQPGSPIQLGDVMVSINGTPLVADATETAGGESYLNMVKGMIGQQQVPRVMRFFRSTSVDGARIEADSAPSQLQLSEVQVFLQG